MIFPNNIPSPRLLTRLACPILLLAAATSAYPLNPEIGDRMSPLAVGYLERGKVMVRNGNYAGVIDQLKHLDSQNVALSGQDRRDCTYLLALALYERGDAECVKLLREFAESYPASSQAVAARLAAADFYFFSHKFANALAEYNEINFDRIAPGDRPLYEYRKGLSLIKTGKFDDARPIFERLRDNRKFNLIADYYIAYLDYVDDEVDSAYTRFLEVDRKMTDADAADGLAPMYYIAQIDYKRGDYDDVISKGKSLLRRNSTPELRPEILRIVGMSYFKRGEYAEADQYLKEYADTPDIEPATDAIYALGVIAYSDGDLASAQRRFETLTPLENDLAQSAYLYLGQIAVKEGDNNAAAVSFEKASQMNFDRQVTATAMFNYIVARTRGGNIPFSSSIPLLKNFLKKFPRSQYAPQAEEYLASAYFNEKDYANALASINRIPSPSAKVIADKQKVLYELGMEAMVNNRPSQARTYLSEAVTLAGTPQIKAQSWLWLADANYALGKYAEAEKAYNSYLSADRRGENRTLATYNLAYAQLMQDKYSNAVSSFANAMKADPMLPQRLYDDALVRMADAQYYAGDYQLALKNYTTAIQNGVQDSDYATLRRAVMYGLAGDINKKISELAAMPSRFPDSKWLPDALLEMGQTYSGIGDTKKAVDSFERLRSSYKQTAQARKGMLNLALTYMQTRDTKKAEEAYREVIRRWPTSEEASLANDDLRRLYAANGGLQEYAAFLKSVPGAPQMDADDMEKLAFEAAETAFAGNSSDISLLERYVADYPNGQFLARALLDIATSKDDAADSDGALAALNRLLDSRSDSPQVPEALMLKAEILEEKGPASRKEALAAFRELEKRGGNDYIADAYAGIMRNTDNASERLKYAALVKNSPGLSADLLEEAELYEASAMLSKDDSGNAVKTLSRLAQNPKSLSGAKAAVELGQYYLDSGILDKAEKTLTNFTDAGSPHEYWLARGFIALADVFHARKKDYLAIEYLKSLRDNYPGDELDIHDMISSRLAKWK